jgi:hypothetical protein
MHLVTNPDSVRRFGAYRMLSMQLVKNQNGQRGFVAFCRSEKLAGVGWLRSRRRSVDWSMSPN